ncbi:MAG: prolyl oligopeptidase family serine peptidase [Bacteroidota bacterium]|nr:prolyl oligopeptidase family serine peptidase [Bacteroidota bacterium]
MMRKVCLVVFLVFILVYGRAQKPPMDTSAIREWPGIGPAGLSPNGCFVYYTLSSNRAESSVINVRNLISSQEIAILGASNEKFSRNSELFVFNTSADSIIILELKTGARRSIANASRYSLSNSLSKECIAYVDNKHPDSLTIRSLTSSEQKSYANVEKYQFSEDGNVITVETNSSGNRRVTRLDLLNFKDRCIWLGNSHFKTIEQLTLNRTGSSIALLVNDRAKGDDTRSLVLYNVERDSMVSLVKGGIERNGVMYELANSSIKFDPNDRNIFYDLRIAGGTNNQESSSIVHIYSYLDFRFNSFFGKDYDVHKNIFKANVNLASGNINILESKNEFLVACSGDFCLLSNSHDVGGHYESFWNHNTRISYYLVSLFDGTRKLVRSALDINNASIELSPTGRWIVFYDKKEQNYFTYDCQSGTKRNITSGVLIKWNLHDRDWSVPTIRSGIKWSNNDGCLLVGSDFDIWQLDPYGSKKPINITGNFGEHNSIRFEIPFLEHDVTGYLDHERRLIVRGFNLGTKDMGFYEIKLDRTQSPDSCFVGPYVFGFWNGEQSAFYPPQKATDTNEYLIIRMSSQSAPNFYITSNFRSFLKLTDFEPQRKYRWLKSELVKFSEDGISYTGLVYKPEDFDPSRKYPVIFSIYERNSDELNLYLSPGISHGPINIPWFVSNGYVVYRPDIYYQIGKPGNSALKAVLAAVNYLKKQRWVDNTHLGIEGHSFGGFETNYIISHSNVFAAACTASGASDMISLYGSGAAGGFSQYHEEMQQGRMGKSLWEVPNLYIDNSPILFANRIKTPLLLMNNRDDSSIPFSQGVEMFTALRRLGKKVWMLEYPGSGHVVYPPSDMDFHVRLSAFFDHYLKGCPAAKWMTTTGL